MTEKIDGTNVRVMLGYRADGDYAQVPVPVVTFGGKTDSAQMPTFLLEHLQKTFTVDKVAAAFDPNTTAILYGEGYGPKIQKGGGSYRPKEAGVSFRLFDVVVFGEKGRPWWLNWTDVEDVARKLGILTVPVLARGASLGEALGLLVIQSSVALEERGVQPGDAEIHEGIVTRTEPLLFTRRGQRVIWKLKVRDYGERPITP